MSDYDVLFLLFILYGVFMQSFVYYLIDKINKLQIDLKYERKDVNE